MPRHHIGGAGGNRTHDARLRTAALYPLSYSPRIARGNSGAADRRTRASRTDGAVGHSPTPRSGVPSYFFFDDFLLDFFGAAFFSLFM